MGASDQTRQTIDFVHLVVKDLKKLGKQAIITQRFRLQKSSLILAHFECG